MEAAATPRRSLGEYFVEKGLITQADLERAHAEHLTTNRRLADVLVRRGLVTGADITRALMDQLGMAAGPPPPPTAPAAPPPEVQEPQGEPEGELPVGEPQGEQRPADQAAADEAAEIGEPRAQPELVLVAAAPGADEPWPGEAVDEPWPGETPIAGPSEESEAWPGEIDFDSWPGQSADEDTAPAAAPTAAAEPADVELPEPDPVESVTAGPAQPEAAAVEAAVPDERPQPSPNVQARIETKQRELSEALATATRLITLASDLQAEVDELVEEARAAAVASPEPPALDEQPTAGPVQERRGAVFLVPRADRFELVELELEAPPVGGTVVVDDRRYVVTRIARSPLPFDRRSCAVLAETSQTS